MLTQTIKVIAIDGPNSTGKGEVSKLLSERLGLKVLSSSMIYRSFSLALYREGVSHNSSTKLEKAVHELAGRMRVGDGKVFIDGKEVGDEIWERRVASLTGLFTQHSVVRKAVIPFQRAFVNDKGLIAEGRDMTSIVFPDARLKVFLTASIEVRAQRKWREERRRSNVSYIDVMSSLRRKDAHDEQRAVSPLIKVSDACVIDATTLTVPEVAERIISEWRARNQN